MKFQVIGVMALMAVQTYPPPFPREDVSKVFENDRVVVWNARWTAGRPSPMHEHKLDLVGVILEGGRTKLTLLDGSIREGPLSKRGDVVFQPKGVIHIEEPLVGGARTIGVELKDVTVAPIDERPALPSAFPRDGARSLLENGRVAIWDYQWLPGRAVPLHYQDRDVVIVAMENGQVRFTTSDGRTRVEHFSFGEVTFRPRGESHREEAIAESPRSDPC
jgi:hypothetical protein